ncbi:thiamine pyrophosphate-dependent enzyme [Jatrophihabitans sp. YIM 134969]
MDRQTGDEKHDASASSVAEVLDALYDDVLDVSPDRAADPDRDRFHLSKGHGPQAYHAVLARHGFFDPALLAGFGSVESPLGHHPDRRQLPGVEISSGSLGHGLALAVGSALALRWQGRSSRVVVLVGDAELDEGSNHEAIAVAGRFGLARLTAVVVDNASASLGWPGGIATRFETEGWVTREVTAADRPALVAALRATDDAAPTVVVAHTDPKGA